MLAKIWRFFVAVFDWRTHLRRLSGKPIVDVVFVTNMRDEIDRKRFLGKWIPPEGHFNGPRYWFGKVAGRTRALDTVTRDLATVSGRKRAKEQFVSAVQWAANRGAKVILLAAGTKRLFGEQGEELKPLFPKMLFTIGDNGTTWLLRSETNRALQSAGLLPGKARICVIGPTGLLGESMVAYLSKSGYDVVGLCANASHVSEVKIEAHSDFEEVGKVDAVVACTHADSVSLTQASVEALRKDGRKLLLIDVAEPANMRRLQYHKCKHVVIRQDAGNAYSSKLEYVLGAISYRLFRLTRGVTFGCFAESLTIAAELSAGNEALKDIDWFDVSEENINLIENLFMKKGFRTPSPRCFGKAVKSFDIRTS